MLPLSSLCVGQVTCRTIATHPFSSHKNSGKAFILFYSILLVSTTKQKLNTKISTHPNDTLVSCNSFRPHQMRHLHNRSPRRTATRAWCIWSSDIGIGPDCNWTRNSCRPHRGESTLRTRTSNFRILEIIGTSGHMTHCRMGFACAVVSTSEQPNTKNSKHI